MRQEADDLGRLLVVFDDMSRFDVGSSEVVPHVFGGVQVGEAVAPTGVDALQAHRKRWEQHHVVQVLQLGRFKKGSKNPGSTTPS